MVQQQHDCGQIRPLNSVPFLLDNNLHLFVVWLINKRRKHVNEQIQSYPVISTSLISTSRYLDINLRSRQKQSLFNKKLPGYLDIFISTTRYLDIISNPLEEKLDIWDFKICKNVWNCKENIKIHWRLLLCSTCIRFKFFNDFVDIFDYMSILDF